MIWLRGLLLHTSKVRVSDQSAPPPAPTYPWGGHRNTDVNIIPIHHLFGCVVNHYERENTCYIELPGLG